MKLPRLRILFRVLRITNLLALIEGFVVVLLFAAFVIEFVEPEIDSYIDALWYLFASFTTIGYGDFVAVTLIGRITTVAISLYGILVVAFIPAVIIAFFNEINSAKRKEINSLYLYKLERLEHLSKEELAEMSAEIRKHRNNLNY